MKAKKNRQHPLYGEYRDVFEKPWCPIYGFVGHSENELEGSDLIISSLWDVIVSARMLLREYCLYNDHRFGFLEGETSWPQLEDLDNIEQINRPDIDISLGRDIFIELVQAILDCHHKGYSPYSIYEFLKLKVPPFKSIINRYSEFKEYQVHVMITIAVAYYGIGDRIMRNITNSEIGSWLRVASELLTKSQVLKKEQDSSILEDDAKKGRAQAERAKKAKSIHSEESGLNDVKKKFYNEFKRRRELEQGVNAAMLHIYNMQGQLGFEAIDKDGNAKKRTQWCFKAWLKQMRKEDKKPKKKLQ